MNICAGAPQSRTAIERRDGGEQEARGPALPESSGSPQGVSPEAAPGLDETLQQGLLTAVVRFKKRSKRFRSLIGLLHAAGASRICPHEHAFHPCSAVRTSALAVCGSPRSAAHLSRARAATSPSQAISLSRRSTCCRASISRAHLGHYSLSDGHSVLNAATSQDVDHVRHQKLLLPLATGLRAHGLVTKCADLT